MKKLIPIALSVAAFAAPLPYQRSLEQRVTALEADLLYLNRVSKYQDLEQIQRSAIDRHYTDLRAADLNLRVCRMALSMGATDLNGRHLDCSDSAQEVEHLQTVLKEAREALEQMQNEHSFLLNTTP